MEHNIGDRIAYIYHNELRVAVVLVCFPDDKYLVGYDTPSVVRRDIIPESEIIHFAPGAMPNHLMEAMIDSISRETLREINIGISTISW